MNTNGLIEDLAKTYSLQKKVLTSVDLSELNSEIVWHNVYALLMHQYVKKLLTATRGTFSLDVTKKDNYAEAIKQVIKLVGNSVTTYRDYEGIKSHPKMLAQLERYARKEPTNSSDRIWKGLNKIFSEYEDNLRELELLPLVYGSVRYGDAGEFSDVDMIYLCSGDLSNPKIKEIIDSIDLKIDEKFEGKNQVKDDLNAQGRSFYLTEFGALLKDVQEKATNCSEDYQFKEQDFYPFNWLLEGRTPIVKREGKAYEEWETTQKELVKIAKIDPFLEFIMCYHLLHSIEKRVQNLKRK